MSCETLSLHKDPDYFFFSMKLFGTWLLVLMLIAGLAALLNANDFSVAKREIAKVEIPAELDHFYYRAKLECRIAGAVGPAIIPGSDDIGAASKGSLDAASLSCVGAPRDCLPDIQ